MLKIALLDDGLSYNRLINNTCYEEYIVRETTISEYTSKKSKFDSHGRICASIIESLTSKPHIISINVKSEFENGACEDVIAALNLCYELNVDIINASIGTCYKKDFYKIKRAIKPLLDKKISIVSATSNDYKVTYPAFLNSVIGVRYNIRGIGGKLIYLEHSKYGVNIETASPTFLIDYNNIKLPLHPCNSFATPVVTSAVCNILDKFGRLTNEELKNVLKKYCYIYKKYDKLNYKNIT